MMQRNNLGQFEASVFSLEPTRDLGYFCGLIIGDGSLRKAKSRNYTITICSPDQDLINIFKELASSFNFNVLSYERQKARPFPNGSIYHGEYTQAIMNSKEFYQALRPYKRKDFQWRIPHFLTTTESLKGFIEGLFDAKGTIYIHNGKYCSMRISSKHKEGLLEIQSILKNYGIKSSIAKSHIHQLIIEDRPSIKLFKRNFTLRLHRKNQKLQEYEDKERTCIQFTEAEEKLLLSQYMRGNKPRELAESFLRSSRTIRYKLATFGIDNYSNQQNDIWS